MTFNDRIEYRLTWIDRMECYWLALMGLIQWWREGAK